MDYRSLVVVVISIPPSNRVIFLACLYAFLNCPSSQLPLSSISFKNNGVEVQKIIKINVCVPTVPLMISFPTEEGFLCDLHKLMHFALCTRKFNEFPQPTFQPLARVVIGSTKRLAQKQIISVFVPGLCWGTSSKLCGIRDRDEATSMALASSKSPRLRAVSRPLGGTGCFGRCKGDGAARGGAAGSGCGALGSPASRGRRHWAPTASHRLHLVKINKQIKKSWKETKENATAISRTGRWHSQ